MRSNCLNVLSAAARIAAKRLSRGGGDRTCLYPVFDALMDARHDHPAASMGTLPPAVWARSRVFTKTVIVLRQASQTLGADVSSLSSLTADQRLGQTGFSSDDLRELNLSCNAAKHSSHGSDLNVETVICGALRRLQRARVAPSTPSPLANAPRPAAVPPAPWPPWSEVAPSAASTQTELVPRLVESKACQTPVNHRHEIFE